MERELPALHVRMLGGERITYGGVRFCVSEAVRQG